jgi:formate dehydrogenase subunit delta
MSKAGPTHGEGEHLITMANDIANYFRPQGREEAIAGIANHIKRYWTLRMREKLNVFLAEGHAGELDELPRAAIERLNQQQPAPSQPATAAGQPAATPSR